MSPGCKSVSEPIFRLCSQLLLLLFWIIGFMHEGHAGEIFAGWQKTFKQILIWRTLTRNQHVHELVRKISVIRVI